jgi:soluble lytic murein transglycosylase-like protein
MTRLPRRHLLALLAALPAACGRRDEALPPAGGPDEVNRLVGHYARAYDVPESLVHRVVQRESGYNPSARNGPYYGLMQILPQTAATMGYRGPPAGLLDADTNLRYGVKYLRGAWLVARGDHDRAVMWYAKGYYYEAKRMGLLEETGLRA